MARTISAERQQATRSTVGKSTNTTCGALLQDVRHTSQTMRIHLKFNFLYARTPAQMVARKTRLLDGKKIPRVRF